MNKTKTITKILGILLVLGGILGFFTVADEFRHSGELIGVVGILIAGLVLLLAASELAISKRLALPWLAAGVLLGIPVGGILLDNMPLGMAIGSLSGLAAAALLAKKAPGVRTRF